MTGRKSVVGLALLCALVFGAIVAQGASAAGTTAFECVKMATPEGAGFSDAHCDNAVTTGATYTHTALPTGSNSITLTNAATKNETKEATPAVLTVAKLHGFSNVTVTASTVTGTGKFENKEVGGVMQSVGTGTIEFSGLTTNQKNCKVKSPIIANAEGTTVEPSAESMGVKLLSVGSENFTTITFENNGGTCGLASFPEIPAKGFVIGTPGGTPTGHGATLVFNTETGMQGLTVGGETATLAGTATLKGPLGNALTVTTTTP